MRTLRKIAATTAICMLCTPSAFNITYADTDYQSAASQSIYDLENSMTEADFVLLDEIPSVDDSVEIDDDDEISSNDNSTYDDLPSEPETTVDPNDGHTIYLLDSADDLIYMRERVRKYTAESAEYRLTADIDLRGMEWEPIGFPEEVNESTTSRSLQTAGFHGTFDGNNHTISNFKITDSKYFRAGFFATMYKAVVYDLNLTDFEIDITYTAENEYAASAVGGLVGYSLHSCILNCNIDGNITVNSSSFGLDSSDKEASIIAIGLAAGDICSAITFGRDNDAIEPRLIEDVKTSGSITAVQNPVSDEETDLSAVLRVGGVIGALIPVSPATASNTADAVNLTSDAVIDAYSSNTLDIGGIAGYATQSEDTLINCKYLKKADTDTETVSEFADDEGDETDTVENGNKPQLYGKASKCTYIGGIAGKTQCFLENCSAEDVDIQGTSSVATYIGGVSGDHISGKIESCLSSANLSSVETDATVSIYIGGITGLNGYGSSYLTTDIFPKISSCTFDGSIYAGRGKSVKSAIGFIAGSNFSEGTISDCTIKSANMSIAQKGLLIYAGGISGINEGGTIERCVNYQDINLTNESGAIYLGGISGSCTKGVIKIYTDTTKTATNSYTYGGKIYDCYNKSDLTLTSAAAVYLGGLVGYLTGQAICDNGQPRIECCFTAGNVTANVTAKVTVLQGGACGYILDSEVTNCYSESNVALNLSDAAAASTAFASGFGRVKQNATNIEFPNSIVWNCYAVGTVTVSDNATNAKKGGFASDLSNNNPKNSPDITTLLPIVRNSYYLSDESDADAEIATPLTTEQFADMNSFTVQTISDDYDTVWDFDDVWYISNGRPHLTIEKTSIHTLEYTSENNQNISIDEVVISKPTANSKLYFAAYSSSGTLLDLQSAEVNDFQNDEFASIELDTPYEIPVLAQSVKVFLWDNDMSPLTDVKAASLTAE